jgi:hypothetical protein|tara:strand:- start:1596 stop:1862 length:267 start_codon:yes stop_codon:yes gene_type:complete
MSDTSEYDVVIDEDSLRYLIEVGEELKQKYINMLCIIRDLHVEGIIAYPEFDPERNDNEEYHIDEDELEVLFTRLDFLEITEREFGHE